MRDWVTFLAGNSLLPLGFGVLLTLDELFLFLIFAQNISVHINIHTLLEFIQLIVRNYHF